MRRLSILIVFAAAIATSYFMATSANCKTNVIVKNPSDTSITVFLRLGVGADPTKWISDVNGIFGITSHGSQGSFILGPGDSVSYRSDKPFMGNVSFAYEPNNCPVGITLYEFTVNNAGTVKKAQETTDISCVAGITSIGTITMAGGGKWIATTGIPVSRIKNKAMGYNTGIPGVFPYGCTNCTNTKGMPSCITDPEKPNSRPICNVSRDATKNGGTITIAFNELLIN